MEQQNQTLKNIYDQIFYKQIQLFYLYNQCFGKFHI